MFSILVVCTGNTCRSPMAEWILRALLEEHGLAQRVNVYSAGLSACAGAPLSQGARRVLEARSLAGAREHQASRVTDDMIAQADLILTMTSFHKMSLRQTFADASQKVFTLSDYAGLGDTDIADPYGGDDDAYREAADHITTACQAVVERLHRELGKSQGVPLQ